ncbi:Malto-oligosyltrehalose trehalohydrolase [Aquisphaera giovannonii]|uniref:Malto-oligosyltrehalose trehalohydrolase n=1 Tax=Aquisphaera giovannonii TaxID=406548 RepID=A0A5B9WFV0_9BACT|nr:malto-oligosyltrehalose trehalohydrolase [Aquisphaera giovannonii]QEH39124.1 Malto-oligosyltrehalose trehalohydrolase [Aquisphaera giovannonii]
MELQVEEHEAGTGNGVAANGRGTRALPVGADLLHGGGTSFRVWAPKRRSVSVVHQPGPSWREDIEGEVVPLEAEPDGYFSGIVPEAGPGTLYKYRLDDSATYPDPASRYQPDGPHGPSQVVDPDAFVWTDGGWRGVEIPGQVIYELHIGTFTRDGTWKSAIAELPALKELGITCLEVMPVAEFPGRFGWGYDGVDLFAPYHVYGTPDDFRRFVDEAHRLGLAVLLDVVYNHLGPDGAYHREFSDDYYHRVREKTEWGDSLNFDGEGSGPVREFFIANAGYWIREFHLDGLRLDATQAIHDESDDHFLAAMARHARKMAGDRPILLIAEDDSQETVRVRPPSEGGYGLDAQWNDDFHHSAMVALTGRSEAYYSDYQGSPQEFISAIKWGFLFQGQYFRWLGRARGSSTYGLPAWSFVTFLENHDQVSNSARGDRLYSLTSPAQYKAMAAAWLLAPGTPMFFQGQEFGATNPFLYFADHVDDLASKVQQGRIEFLSTFRSIANPDFQEYLPNPAAIETFVGSKLDFSERARHPGLLALHRDLLRLRREDPIFRTQRADRIFGAVIGPDAYLLRYFGEKDDCRLVLTNLGRDIFPNPASEPLMAPPKGRRWEILWYSEHPQYGGCGAPPFESETEWRMPGRATVVLKPVPLEGP